MSPMSSASPAIPATRRHPRRVDRVRVVLPIERGGANQDTAAGRKFARFMAEHLPDGYDVSYRNDQGIIVRVDFARPTSRGASPAGAVHAAAAVLGALETALERIGRRSADRGDALERLLPYVDVKTRPAA